MSFDEFIAYVESKITPFTLSESGRSDMAMLYKQYSEESLKECIDIGINQYFRYDGNCKPTSESVEEFLCKLGGIAYNRSLSSIDREINHVKAIGRKAFDNWNDYRANGILHDYVDALKNASWSDDQIINDLRADTVRLISRSRSCSQWYKAMQGWISDIQQWSENDTTTISEDGSIIPTHIFDGVRQNIQSLCKQINASYENNLYDCTAVIMRRLLEVLLVLSYQKHGLESDIIDESGNRHVTLDKMIKNTQQNKELALSSNTKKDMALFKDLGNYSAHKIWYNCTQKDIQPNIMKYRVIIEELLYKAGLK
ncbi:MAG: hypothetical protein LUE20_01810 [Oscillospiraceae bacterium]|nr:hypothetical protein [Oscillospiraceae bacterium]